MSKDPMVLLWLLLHAVTTAEPDQCGSTPWRCKAGHNHPPSSCSAAPLVLERTVGGVAAIVHPSTVSSSSSSHAKHERTVLHQWQAQLAPPSDAPPRCSNTPAFLVIVPYHSSYDGGSNYYHFHIDLLLPLYQSLACAGVITASNEPVDAVLLPAVSILEGPTEEEPRSGALDWTTQAFDKPTQYWNRALALLTDLPVVPLAASQFDAAVQRLGEATDKAAGATCTGDGNATALCFCQAHFGVPSLEHPPAALVRRFVDFMRHRLDLRRAPIACDQPHTIGFVTRTNRRRLLNQDALIAAIQDALPTATVELFDFGRQPFDQDARDLQHVHVLVGGQGSGLLNGWYLPPESSAVVLYQFGAWDVFDEYLSPRGPYLYWVNGNESNSVCNRTIDRFCDSPDTVVDIPAALAVIKRALDLAVAHCQTG